MSIPTDSNIDRLRFEEIAERVGVNVGHMKRGASEAGSTGALEESRRFHYGVGDGAPTEPPSAAEAGLDAVAAAVVGAPDGAEIDVSIAPAPDLPAGLAASVAEGASPEVVDASKITVTLGTRKFFYDWASEKAEKRFNDPAFAFRYACFRIDALFEQVLKFVTFGKWRPRDYIDEGALEGAGSNVGARAIKKDGRVGAISFSVARHGNIGGCPKVGSDIAAVANGMFGEKPNIRSGGYHCAGIVENLILQQKECDRAGVSSGGADGAAKLIVGKEKCLCTIAYGFLNTLADDLFAETMVQLCSRPESLPLLTEMFESIQQPYAEGIFRKISQMNADAQKIAYGAVGKNGESIVLTASKAGKNIFNASMEAAIRCLGIFSSRSMARKVAARAFWKGQRTRESFEEDVESLIKNEI
ncbi:MAG: hypothetical protein LBI39_00045 [Puniceicoccales bacterium]|jgi:hypothetical protein|nr:hypothetical protein [Puniceicoccales bacterium]